MEQITLKDFLNGSVREKWTGYAIDGNGNDTTIHHVNFIDDIIEIQVDIVAERAGADFSSNDPQQHNFGTNKYEYHIRFIVDGDVVEPEKSGIILPEHWKEVIELEAWCAI